MNKCSGRIIPQYKDIYETKSNPFYCKTNIQSLGSFSGINTTDEFIRIHHKVEIEPICFDCKKKDCGSN